MGRVLFQVNVGISDNTEKWKNKTTIFFNGTDTKMLKKI